MTSTSFPIYNNNAVNEMQTLNRLSVLRLFNRLLVCSRSALLNSERNTRYALFIMSFLLFFPYLVRAGMPVLVLVPCAVWYCRSKKNYFFFQFEPSKNISTFSYCRHEIFIRISHHYVRKIEMQFDAC